MLSRLTGWDDTIAAIATPPGIGAIATIRLSGPRAFTIADMLFPSKKMTGQPSHTLHVGFLKLGERTIDEVVLSLFRAPKSYTGEDVVEISCHGSPHIQEQVLEACLETGARLARPGEFTQRAFLYGKMDLAQAEAVADLIYSHSEASRLAALHTMRGGFAAELKILRERLLTFSALLELELDFSQEDVAFADRAALELLISESEQRTNALLLSFQFGNVIKNGVQVAIIGKPNAGKSTLLNTLLNDNRAIVSDIPGTTRDTIEEILNIDGILFRLIDTAGIRDHTLDSIEHMGIEKSREKMEQADLVLFLLDAKDPDISVSLPTDKDKHIRVVNKADLFSAEALAKRFVDLDPVMYISAKSGTGIEALKKSLVAQVMQGRVKPEGTIITNQRHYEALKQVSLSLTDTRKGMDEGLPGDLLALHIRSCLHYLGEITGEVTTEEQLGWIFGKFCIGK